MSADPLGLNDMIINLRAVLAALCRFVSVFFMARFLASVGSWTFLSRIATDDPFFGYARSMTALSAGTNLVFFLVFFLLAPVIARWIAPEGSRAVEEPPETFALVGVRLVGLFFLVFGVVLGVTQFLGWYVQTASGHVSEVWYPQAKILGAALLGAVSAVAGVAVLVGSQRLSAYLIRSRRAAA